MKGKKDRKSDKNIKCSFEPLAVFCGLAAEYVFSYIMTSDQKRANYQSLPWPLQSLVTGTTQVSVILIFIDEHESFPSVSHIIYSPVMCLRSDIRSHECEFVHVHLHTSTFENPAHGSNEKNKHNPIPKWILQIPLRKLNDLLKYFTKKPHTVLVWCIRCGSACFWRKKPLL